MRASGPDYAIAVWRNVVVVVFVATPSEEAARQMASVSAEVAQACGGLGMLHVVDAPGGAPPGAPAREHYKSMIRGLEDHFAGAAIIAAGKGFVPSMVRSVVVGFTIALRPRFPMKTFSNVGEGAAWLSDLMSLSEAELLAAAAATRDAIGQ